MSRAGRVPVVALAAPVWLSGLVREHVAIDHPCGVNAHLKIGSVVAGMVAGADSIDDMDLLRHGAMDAIFGGVRAPSTLGSHLRAYTWGHVRQLESVNRQLLVRLSRHTPLLPDGGTLAFVEVDSMQKRVYGHAKQGARFGPTKVQGKTVLVRGLNALTQRVNTARAAGCSGTIVTRADYAALRGPHEDAADAPSLRSSTDG
ncbi:MAG: hypothetical protein ACRDMV_08875 [Streptosporangiales bacterium]